MNYENQNAVLLPQLIRNDISDREVAWVLEGDSLEIEPIVEDVEFEEIEEEEEPWDAGLARREAAELGWVITKATGRLVTGVFYVVLMLAALPFIVVWQLLTARPSVPVSRRRRPMRSCSPGNINVGVNVNAHRGANVNVNVNVNQL